VSASLNITEELKVAVDSWDTDLAPTKDIFFDYKQNGDWAKYVLKFKTDVLPKIDWLEKLEMYETIANKIGKTVDNIVFCCYESADTIDGKGNFCHRFILAESLEKEFPTKVLEYGYEKYDRKNCRLIKPISTDFLF